ncbi:hypothetical protein THRCLA_22677 [Thraustotheca clavata]|uniref:Tc1-like transposase DDE domain-containing protein n=1 Tax=Thraustotheca clavata TaxID=74557 RepID=A0A1V9YUN2_9STRA|nr:hypothetical protein THRCLA_22677 [Thraustotheca clavata]
MEEQLDILYMHAYLRQQGISSVSQHIAKILGRGIRVVKEVWSEYKNNSTITAKTVPSNKTNHATRVPDTKVVLELVQNLLRQKRLIRARVVAKGVMALLVEIGDIAVDNSNSHDVAACLRAVLTYLVKKGFQRCLPGASSVPLSLAPNVILARDNYVKIMSPALSSTPELAMLYCWHTKQTWDYHGMFNHKYFVEWFKCLLDQLAHIGKENVAIVLDYALYHKELPLDTPKGSWCKANLLQACKTYGISASNTEYNRQIWFKLKCYIKSIIKPVIVAMAADRDHTVVYTPPYHSRLQPIELLWAYVKGRVGRQYTVTTTFEDVRTRVNEAFDSIPSDVIFNCIRNSTTEVERLDRYINELDAPDGSDTVEDDLEVSSESDGSADMRLV